MENNEISIKLTNENEYLIAAHNLDKTAHGNVFKEINNKINLLQSSLYELEDNVSFTPEIPSKLSSFQNDIDFVTKETMLNALKIRGFVNGEELNNAVQTLEEILKSYVKTLIAAARAELKTYFEDSIKILSRKIEELEDDIINLTPDKTEDTIL